MKHSKITLFAALLVASFAAPAMAADTHRSSASGLIMNDRPFSGEACGELLQQMIRDHGKNKLRYTLDTNITARGIFVREKFHTNDLLGIDVGQIEFEELFLKSGVYVPAFKPVDNVCIFLIHDALDKCNAASTSTSTSGSKNKNQRLRLMTRQHKISPRCQ